jgi:hypothetical protein
MPTVAHLVDLSLLTSNEQARLGTQGVQFSSVTTVQIIALAVALLLVIWVVRGFRRSAEKTVSAAYALGNIHRHALDMRQPRSNVCVK